MPSKTKNNNQRFSWFTKKRVIAIAVLLVLLLIFDFSPFGGNITFYSTWIRCGRKPVATDISLGFGAKPLSYKEPSSFEPVRFGTPGYFCTPREAEQHGYTAN